MTAARPGLALFLPWKPDIINEVAFDSVDSNLVLAATSDGIYQSLDGGKTWLFRGGGMPQGGVTSVIFHPLHHNEAYALHFGYVYQSLDGGRKWTVFDRGGLSNVIFHTISFDVAGATPRPLWIDRFARGVYLYGRSATCLGECTGRPASRVQAPPD